MAIAIKEVAAKASIAPPLAVTNVAADILAPKVQMMLNAPTNALEPRPAEIPQTIPANAMTNAETWRKSWLRYAGATEPRAKPLVTNKAIAPNARTLARVLDIVNSARSRRAPHKKEVRKKCQGA